MTTKLCVFVSSVQKELEDERLIVQNLMNTDAFLSAHCMPVLYELEPASPGKALEGCLQSLDGLREALVNAVAHRQYEDAGRKIILEVFADRVILLSPGLPPKPITLAGLRRGKYRPCSRNPVLAQCLSYFHRIEERGSGFRRMRDQMLDHGLDPPILGSDMGYFQVTFPGPGDNIERLRVPEKRLLVTPAVEAQLNERQRKMLLWLIEGKELTSRQCEAEFGVTRPITAGDFGKLAKMELAEKVGAGRSSRYRLKGMR